MASKTVFYKEQPFVIEVSDVDTELFDKSWSLTFDHKKKKDGSSAKNTYFNIKRTLPKAEREARGMSRISLHKEVWIKHFGNVPEGMTIDHIDHNPCNNCILNLQLLSIKENIQRQKRIKKNADNQSGTDIAV